MKWRVFYSWQDDDRACRNLIESALKRAIKTVNREIAPAGQLVLDQDTRGEPGHPDVVETICRKIRTAAVFVPDISLVSKGFPNPNVVYEHGYAQRAIGPERIVPVFNEHYGGIEDLPFDLRLSRGALRARFQWTDGEDKAPVRDVLSGVLGREFKTILRSGVLYCGLSPAAVAIAEHLVSNSELGSEAHEPTREISEIQAALGMDVAELLSGLRELHYKAFVQEVEVSGAAEFQHFRATGSLFESLDAALLGEWNTEEDARSVAELLVDPKRGRREARLAWIAEELAWPPRRLNPAASLLLRRRLVAKGSRIQEASDFMVRSLRPNEATELFVKGRTPYSDQRLLRS